MRFRLRQAALCLYFFIEVICAYHTNDYLKNNQRTNPKKYFSTNAIGAPSYLDNYSFSASSNNNVKIRHHRPIFDKLKSRIDRLGNGLYSDSSASSHESYRYGDFGKGRHDSDGLSAKLRHQAHEFSSRHKTTTTTTSTSSPDEELFNNYGDLLDSEDEKMAEKVTENKNKQRDTESLEDEEPIYEDDLFDSLDDDEGDDETDDYDNVQAEEPTERPTPAPTRHSSLSEYKWAHYGTMQGVEEARRKQLNLWKASEVVVSENKARAAVEHYIRVKNTGLCQKPIPKVIPIQQEHPNPSVTYTPHCTVLHRCAEDTGCCRHDGAICQYKERVEIPLYFYVKDIGSVQARVEKLTFYNHTECECREKPDDNSTERQKRIAPPSSSMIIAGSELTFKPGNEIRTRNDAPENLQIKCKCPKEFIPKIKYSSKCFCDCEETNEDCLRMKKGKEYNSLSDRLCILNNQCGVVQCEYGNYNKEIGRCPRRDE